MDMPLSKFSPDLLMAHLERGSAGSVVLTMAFVSNDLKGLHFSLDRINDCRAAGEAEEISARAGEYGGMLRHFERLSVGVLFG